MAKSKELILSGMALRGLVRAAETPVSGQLVKRQLFSDLELDEVARFDFRDEGEPEIAILPVHPQREED